MCLLLTATSAKMRSTLLNVPGLIEDIYSKNSDGLGAMYATKTGLKVVKTLPKNAADVRKFVESLPNDDRELALHFRWRTHGEINLAQCHPYPVIEGTALMHNGILSTGNKADVTKSDTYHFIADYLANMSADNLHCPKVTEMIGEYIGENKFAIMSADGRLTVINKDQGVAYDGVWYSNTYAWEPSLVIPTYKKRAVYSGFTSSQWSQGISKRDMWAGMDDGDDLYGASPLDRSMAYDEEDDDVFQVAECVDQAIYDQDNEELEALIEEFPMETLRHIADNYDVTEYENTNDEDLTPGVVAVRQALCRGDLLDLLERLEDDQAGIMPDRIATCLTWFCMAEPRPSTITTRLKELA